MGGIQPEEIPPMEPFLRLDLPQADGFPAVAVVDLAGGFFVHVNNLGLCRVGQEVSLAERPGGPRYVLQARQLLVIRALLPKLTADGGVGVVRSGGRGAG